MILASIIVFLVLAPVAVILYCVVKIIKTTNRWYKTKEGKFQRDIEIVLRYDRDYYRKLQKVNAELDLFLLFNSIALHDEI